MRSRTNLFQTLPISSALKQKKTRYTFFSFSDQIKTVKLYEFRDFSCVYLRTKATLADYANLVLNHALIRWQILVCDWTKYFFTLLRSSAVVDCFSHSILRKVMELPRKYGNQILIVSDVLKSKKKAKAVIGRKTLLKFA